MRFFRVLPWADRVYLEYSIYRGKRAEAVGKRECLYRDQYLYRQIWIPLMGENVSDLIAHNFFSFQSRFCLRESLIWSKYAPDIECVHSIGRIQKSKFSKNSDYGGVARAKIDDVLNYKTPDGKWTVGLEHAPEEGMFHVHVFPVSNCNNSNITKNIKKEIRHGMIAIFSTKYENT